MSGTYTYFSVRSLQRLREEIQVELDKTAIHIVKVND